jgi:hypothetical protein
VTKAIEAALEANRTAWPTGLCRRVWDFLTEVADDRVKTPAHLSRWYNLTGFCLRPGFGDPLDRYRVEALWKLITGATAAAAGKWPTVMEGGADYWIMWRRVCGGLNAALQQVLWSKLKPTLLPPKGKPAPRPHPNELAEMWRAAAALERLDAHTRRLLGEELVRQVQRGPAPHYAFWALTRLGARRSFYGPLNTIVHPDVAEQWLDALVGYTPANDAERMGWGFCLAEVARRTGLRGVDVDDEHRRRVAAALRAAGVPEGWPRMVEEVVEAEGDEQSRLFGESLPIGLRLAGG